MIAFVAFVRKASAGRSPSTVPTRAERCGVTLEAPVLPFGATSGLRERRLVRAAGFGYERSTVDAGFSPRFGGIVPRKRAPVEVACESPRGYEVGGSQTSGRAC